MTHKKQRPHELNDAAVKETRWIEPMNKPIIHSDLKENTTKKTGETPEEKSNNKRVRMRESKQDNQHAYRHDKILRKTIPKNSV